MNLWRTTGLYDDSSIRFFLFLKTKIPSNTELAKQEMKEELENVPDNPCGLESEYQNDVPSNLTRGRYEGEECNGVPNGHGVFYFGNGDIYEGDFVNGRFEGHE